MNTPRFLATLPFVAVLTACGDDSTSGTSMTGTGGKDGAGAVSSQTIVDLAVATPTLSTLAQAVQAADLATTLAGPGPFTVFAPTNAAFAELPTGVLDSLLADKPALKNVLLYHVTSGEVRANQVKALSKVTTLQGSIAVVDASTGVRLNDASVTSADVMASNGVVHVIDAVLIPADKNVVEVAVADGRFKTLAAAIQAAGLADTLSAEGPFTVFAPTDAAFAALPAGTLDALLADVPALRNVLLYHVVSGRVVSGDLTDGASPETLLSGKTVTVNLMGGVKINDATVGPANVLATNGVIHVLDKVLTPPAS
ncbi:MAG: fasciclin domain-containing protein [Polyangiaceae bacterium]|nr:fasciclin domain-containing protein [Polyangiaceae bacterium]